MRRWFVVLLVLILVMPAGSVYAGEWSLSVSSSNGYITVKNGVVTAAGITLGALAVLYGVYHYRVDDWEAAAEPEAPPAVTSRTLIAADLFLPLFTYRF